MDRLVTQAEYARHRGVSKVSIHKRTTTAGGPIPVHGPRKLIDVAEADALWFATMSPAGLTRATNAARAALDVESGALPSATALARARAAVMVAEAQLRRLRLDERRGQLLDRQATLAKFYAVLRSVRDAWLAWPARVGAELAAELAVEPARLMIALDRYVNRQLVELSTAQLDLGADDSMLRSSSPHAGKSGDSAEEDDGDRTHGTAGARRNGGARVTS